MREKLRHLRKSAQAVVYPLLAIQQMDLLYLFGIASRHSGLALSFCPYHFIFLKIFVYLSLTAVGLRCCTGFLQLGRAWIALYLWCTGFLLRWLLLLQSMGSGAQAQQLCQAQLFQRVGSSQTRDGTGVPCIARWILNNWTPGKPLSLQKP